MLRRVGLAHRQHLEHIGVLTGCRDLRVFPRADLSLRRWSTTTALALKPKLHRTLIDDTNGEKHAQLPKELALPQVRNGKTPPPSVEGTAVSADTVSAVNHLLSRSTGEKAILSIIRNSPHLFEIFTDPREVRKLAETLANSQFPIRSVRVLRIAHTLGCHLKQGIYESVSYHLAHARHWNVVLLVILLGKRQSGRTSPRLLNWRTRALVETQNYALLPDVLLEFKANEFVPTRRVYHLILSAHIRNRDLAKAKECLHAMAEAGYPADPSTHAIVATHYRSLGADAHVQARSLEALPGVKRTTATAIINSLMQHHLDARDLPRTLQLLGLFDQYSVDFVLAEFFTGHAEGTQKLDASVRALAPLPSSSYTQQIYPNATTFSLFINYMAAESNLGAALRLFRGTIAAGIEPSSSLITALINALFSAGQGDVGVRIIAKMCDPKRTPFSMFRPILLSTSESDLPWVPSGVMFTTQIFNALLRNSLRVHGLKSIPVILRVMEGNKTRPNTTTLEIIISHLNKTRSIPSGALVRMLNKFRSSTVRPSLRVMHVLLSRVLHQQKLLHHGVGWNTTGLNFSPRRQENQVIHPKPPLPDPSATFDPTAGMETPYHTPHRSHLDSFLQSLSARHINSDPAMIALRIRSDSVIGSDLESAKDIFDTLLVRGMHPNEYHFSALMEGLTRSGDVQGALDVMRSAERIGVKPNVVMFTILIVGYARQGSPQQAIRVFRHMVLAGIQPDVPSIDAVTSAFFAIGAYPMAKKVLISLWPHIQPFPREYRNDSLKQLARRFRRLHRNTEKDKVTLSKYELLSLHRKFGRFRGFWQQRWVERNGLMSRKRKIPKASHI